jgi:hypothetical protein
MKVIYAIIDVLDTIAWHIGELWAELRCRL